MQPNSRWIRSACGSGDDAVAIPRCALAWTRALSGSAATGLRCRTIGIELVEKRGEA